MYAQPRLGCPNCEYTIRYKLMLKEMETELRKLPKGTRSGSQKWPAMRLIQMVYEVASMANSTKTTKRNWTVLTAQLVSIYRGESSKMRAIDNFKLAEQVTPQGSKPNNAPKDDYNDED